MDESNINPPPSVDYETENVIMNRIMLMRLKRIWMRVLNF